VDMIVNFKTSAYKSFSNISPKDFVDYLKGEYLTSETVQVDQTSCELLMIARYSEKDASLTIRGTQTEMEMFYILWNMISDVDFPMSNVAQNGSLVQSISDGKKGWVIVQARQCLVCHITDGSVKVFSDLEDLNSNYTKIS
jgi:hypothetical protein